MMQAVLLWLPIVLAVGGLGVVMLWIWFDCPERTPDDIIEFLQHVDLEKFLSLLNPVNEVALRDQMSNRAFRRVQRKRVHLCIEFLKRMSHNSGLLTELASRQSLHGANADIVEASVALQQQGVRVKIYALSTLLKLYLRLLMRFDSWFMFGALSLYGVRETCGIRGLESYDKLKTAAGMLFLRLESKRFNELIEAL